MLQEAPSPYHAAKAREPSAREVRDAVLRPVLRQPWEENRAPGLAFIGTSAHLVPRANGGMTVRARR